MSDTQRTLADVASMCEDFARVSDVPNSDWPAYAATVREAIYEMRAAESLMRAYGSVTMGLQAAKLEAIIGEKP